MLVIYFVQILCSVFTCSPTTKSVYLSNSSVVNVVDVDVDTGFVPISKTVKISDASSLPITLYTFPPPIIKKRQVVENPIVQTNEGDLRGFAVKSSSGKFFSAFQGIPFAEAPVGDLRFRAPVKKSGWVGVRDAIAESPTCLQLDFLQMYKVTGTEDCLHLNVYSHKLPTRGQKLINPSPVMVFIHGGGFYFGAANLYGPSYLMEEDIVLVTINYRLGALGFLSTGDAEGPGNNGLKDQALALKWVHENIHYFGGDPTRVTIFGESAGAGSVQFHMLSPLSKGLFHRGISQSGCTFCFWSISEKAAEIAKTFATGLNCTTGNSTQMMNCLRELPASQIALGHLQFLEWTMYPVVVFGPVIEAKHKGAFLTDTPANIYRRGEAARVPWISGFNEAEGALNIATILADPNSILGINDEWDRIGPIFLELNNSATHPIKVARHVKEYYMGNRNISFENRHEVVKMFSDRYVIACGVKALKYHAKFSGSKVYAYRLNYRGKYSFVQGLGQKPEDWGVSHLDDLIYLMNSTMYPVLKVGEEDYQFSRLLINLWTNFAKNGEPTQTSPNGSGELIDFWKPLKTGNDLEYLEINKTLKMIPDPYSRQIQFWNNLQLEDGTD